VRHPLERLSPPATKTSCLALFLLWGLLTIVLVTVVPPGHARELWRVLHSADAGEAAAIVAGWPSDVRASARFLIRFDFLYDVVHNNAVALLCLWAAHRLGSGRAWATARVVAWLMWLGTLSNVGENVAALRLVSGIDASWFGLIVVSTMFRFATLWLGVALGGLGLAVAARRNRTAGVG
jgi:hypothetical protein